MTLDVADIDTAGLPLPTAQPRDGGVHDELDAVTTVLTERASALGVEIIRGVRRSPR